MFLTNEQIEKAWSSYLYLESLGLYRNYRIREVYVRYILGRQRDAYYESKKLKYSDWGGTPPCEVKTRVIKKKKSNSYRVNPKTCLGLIDKTFDFVEGSNKEVIYRKDSEFDFIFCLLDNKSFEIVFSVLLPLNSCELARTIIHNKILKRGQEQKEKIENGVPSGNDSCSVTWGDICYDPEIVILNKSKNLILDDPN